MVWNRTPEKCAALREAGAQVAASIEQLFEATSTTILMLKDEEAIDAVLGRASEAFERRVRDHTIVQAGTVAPDYSAELAKAIEVIGGRYVEAPVSGSREPAERGQLVMMLAGEEKDATSISSLLAPVCSSSMYCGAAPKALQMKLAINHYLITMVTGLCEAFHFARSTGVDPEQFRAILDAGPMASDVSRTKLAKLAAEDFSPQASLADVLKNAELVARGNHTTGSPNPLLEISRQLFAKAVEARGPVEDMSAVIGAYEAGCAAKIAQAVRIVRDGPHGTMTSDSSS